MRIAVSSKRRKYDRIVVNLASMIDVSFLLLFYFMAATMLEDREKRLSTALQTQSSTVAAADFQPQVVEVRLVENVPAYVLGTHVCRTREQLTSVLEPLPRDPGVFVKVFDGMDVGFAVSAIQVARDAGFQQVTYVPAK